MSSAKASPTDEALQRELVQLRHKSAQTEETLRKLGHLSTVLSAVRNINQLIVRETEPQDLIQKACDIFVETKGYWNCLIALFDQSSQLIASAESGLGKVFLPKVEELRLGELSGVCRTAMERAEVVVTGDPVSTCPDCPLSHAYSGRAGIAAPIAYGGHTYGLLCASIPSIFVSDTEEQQVFREVARDIAFALDSIKLKREREETEAKLRESEEKYRSLFNEALDMIHIVDAKGRIIDANPSELKTMGYTKEEYFGKPLLEVVHPADQSTTRKALDSVLKGGEIRAYQTALFTKEGKKVEVEVNAVPLLKKGEVAGARAVARDATERNQITRALRKSESTLQTMLSAVPTGIGWVCDRVLGWTNEKFHHMTGYSGDELMGKSARMLYESDEEFERVGRVKYEQIRRSGSGSIETRLRRKDGSLIDVFLNSSAVDPADLSAGLVFSVTDLTETKKAERALRESEERYRSVIDNVGIGVSLISPDMKILALNRQMKEWFPSADESGMPICYRAFNDPPRDQICDYCPTYKTLADGQRHEAVTSTPTGRGIKHYRIVSTPIKDENSRVVSAIELVEDITGKKRAEEEKYRLEKELRQAQKMEAIGTLAGGIAHDFNNILASIVGYAELSLDDAEKGSTLAANLREILRAGGRAADLVRHILTFSRQSDEKRKPIQITPLVKEVLQLLRSSIPTTIDIRRNVESDLDNVLADPVQIHQIVMNLCTNAAHAMREDGGILEVNLKQVRIDSDSIPEHPDITPGQYLRLTVSDTGLGMALETVERMFEPYFTTKQKGEGTGMGLSLVHGIVKSCDGTIKVYSEPGNGTTFNVYLPAIEGRARAQEESQEPFPTGTERILFVDDEPTLADLGRKRLMRLGYEVTTRTSSTEALELFKAKPQAFDLAITDMTMPHMAGDELVREMKKVRPDIPVILCTGFSTQISEEKAKGIGIRAFAMKPIVTQELAEMVRQVLDGKEKRKTDCIRCSP